MVLILIWPIAGFCQTHIRDRQTGDTARVIDGKLQTSATLSGTVTTVTNINIGTVGGTAVAQTNGVQTVYDLSPKATTTTGIGNQSTNTIGVSSEQLTNLITKVDLLLEYYTNGVPLNSTNLVSIQGNVGLTNNLGDMTNNAGDYLETAPRASTNAISGNVAVYTPASTNLNVTGWPMVVTNLTLTNSTDTALIAGDSLGPGNWEVNGIARTANGKALLLGADYVRTVADNSCIDLLITDRPITFPAASAAVAIAQADLPYIIGVVRFGTNGVNADVGRPWNVLDATNMVCSQSVTMGLKPATNSIFLYRKTMVATTNLLSDYLKLTIQNE